MKADGKRTQVRLLRFKGDGVQIETMTGRPRKQMYLEWKELDARTLAGCGMSCVEPDDENGILAVVKAYKE